LYFVQWMDSVQKLVFIATFLENRIAVLKIAPNFLSASKNSRSLNLSR